MRTAPEAFKQRAVRSIILKDMWRSPKKKQDQELNEELARIMVLGEVLNNPGFKKYGRK